MSIIIIIIIVIIIIIMIMIMIMIIIVVVVVIVIIITTTKIWVRGYSKLGDTQNWNNWGYARVDGWNIFLQGTTGTSQVLS